MREVPQGRRQGEEDKVTRPRKSTPLTLAKAEEALDIRAANWAGRCYEIATGFVELGLVKGRAVYGHYRGKVAPDSYFGKLGRAGTEFQRHGWVLLEDGTVCDPTRWTFTGEEPTIHFGPKSEEYDEGGNHLRALLFPECPEFNASEKSYYLGISILPGPAWHHVEVMIGEAAGPRTAELTVSQLHWLANAPIQALGGHAKEVYGAIEKTIGRAWVPVDNWYMVFPERTETKAKAKRRKS